MPRSPLKGFVLAIGLFAFALIGGYITLSLFEVWAYLPFWFQNLALIGTLAAIYVLARKWARSAKLFQRHGKEGMALPHRTRLRRWGALAGIVLVGLIAGFQYAGDAAKGRIFQSFALNLRQPPAEVALSILATPPAYTGLTEVAIYSGREGPVRHFEAGEQQILPEGSVLEITIGGVGTYSPSIYFAGKAVSGDLASDGRYHASVPVYENGVLDIQVGPYVSARHRIGIIPDGDPEVTLAEAPRITTRKSLKLRTSFQDDHGLSDVYLELSRRGLTKTEKQIIPLPLLARGGNADGETFFVNLLANPWAGTTAAATLVGVDALGQEGRSDTVTVLLPEKEFTNHAADSLISIRKALITSPERKSAQVRRLDLITQDLRSGKGNLAVYAALRSAYWKLRSAETQEDIDEVSRMLWHAALSLEGDGAREEQDVHNLFTEITRLLVEGKEPERASRLAQRLEGRMTFLFDKEFQMFSRRTGMAGSLQGLDIPALDNFRSLIRKIEGLAGDGKNAEALEALLKLQGYFETVAIPPERRDPS